MTPASTRSIFNLASWRAPETAHWASSQIVLDNQRPRQGVVNAPTMATFLFGTFLIKPPFLWFYFSLQILLPFQSGSSSPLPYG
ncbi:MAG: hypothetical protein AMJ94_15700 [Deltaproteobacteria bacterium SM23_61]|nr:MAG: hypothetical protein AMJ94_15700 [Deltaproteobacteria bacterium SM23_61]